jgi:hypothetical protein
MYRPMYRTWLFSLWDSNPSSLLASLCPSRQVNWKRADPSRTGPECRSSGALTISTLAAPNLLAGSKKSSLLDINNFKRDDSELCPSHSPVKRFKTAQDQQVVPALHTFPTCSAPLIRRLETSTSTSTSLPLPLSLSILLSHSFFGDLIVVLSTGNILTSRYTTETINTILVPGTQPKQDYSPCLKPTSTRNISDPARRRLTSSLTLFLECEVQVSFPGLPLLILLVGHLERSPLLPLARLPLLFEL